LLRHAHGSFGGGRYHHQDITEVDSDTKRQIKFYH
jgi:hypothetical protein